MQADGQILAGGIFTNIGGAARNRIARLDAVTGLADSFNPNASARVYSMAVQTDGKIVVAGQFTNIGGQPRNYMARLDATTGLADSFDPNGNGSLPEPGVFAVVLQADGKILACGRFSTIGGQTRNNIARLDAVTGLADSWNPDASVGLQGVYSMAVQADGKIVVAYGGMTIGGQTRNRIARLDPVTGLADAYDPNASNFVYAVAVQADGKILAGGAFAGANSIGGQTRNFFARLSNGNAALQNVAVTPTAVSWTRAGASPLLAHATFEFSTDNSSYTPLGDGTPAGGANWSLTGLNFPAGQNFYVRARGFYRGSFLSTSESITESVRTGFFAPPVITSANNTTFTVTTTGFPTGDSMMITESGGLPGGVTLVNNNNGTATLAGTPNAGHRWHIPDHDHGQQRSPAGRNAKLHTHGQPAAGHHQWPAAFFRHRWRSLQFQLHGDWFPRAYLQRQCGRLTRWPWFKQHGGHQRHTDDSWRFLRHRGASFQHGGLLRYRSVYDHHYGSDSDSNTNANGYCNVHTYSYSDGYIYAYADGNGHLHAYADPGGITNADGYSDVYTYTDRYSHLHADSDRYGDVHTNSYSDGYVYSNANGYGDRYSHTDSDCHSHSDAHSWTDSAARPEEKEPWIKFRAYEVEGGDLTRHRCLPR